MSPFPESRRIVFVGLALAALAVALFLPALRAPFCGLDDPAYVTQNPQVRAGLTGPGIAWAFSTVYAANYHPLAWLSHMLDVDLFGAGPKGPHLVNILLHAANAALLFLLLHASTGSTWRSAFVAALFAVHPMHVEAVVWIAERKELLCAFFSLLALRAHLRHVQNPGTTAGWPVAALMAAALLAKPMAVTLPFVMLLLDRWPLGRMQAGMKSLLLEKVPLFALSALCCAVTVFAQSRGKALALDLRDFPLHERLASVVTAYAAYLGKLAWPADLAIYYPFNDFSFHPGETAAAAALIAAISFVAWRTRRVQPWTAFGWLFFLGTMVPVIGLVRVGEQFIADRYTYIPYIGLFVAVVWSAPGLAGRFRLGRTPVIAAGVPVILLLGAASLMQLTLWRSNETLLRHAISVTEGNWLIENLLGLELESQGRADEARLHFAESIRINPLYDAARDNLARAYAREGRAGEALEQIEKLLMIHPDSAEIHNNAGILLDVSKRYDEAEKHFLEALRIKPGDPGTLSNLATHYRAVGRNDDAVLTLQELLRRNPGDGNARRQVEEMVGKKRGEQGRGSAR